MADNSSQTQKLIDRALQVRDGQLNAIGYELFGDSYDIRAFILAFLNAEKYNELAVIISCGFISKQYRDKDFFTAKSDVLLSARYFDLFLELIDEYGIDRELVMPMLFAVYDKNSGEVLRSWSKAMDVYLIRSAYDDFDRAALLIEKYDKSYLSYSALLEADRAKTADILLDKLIYGKGANNNKIRKFLFNHKIDIVPVLKNIYFNGKQFEREAAVRVLLLYKNDARAEDVLSYAAANDKSVTIQKLLHKDVGASKEPQAKTSRKRMFYDAMRFKRDFTDKEFIKMLDNKEYEEFLENLFFIDRTNFNVIIVNGGRIENLQNEPYTLSQDAKIGVLHPCELNQATAFLKNLNIDQPFEQIRRETFAPNDDEMCYNFVRRFNGTIVNGAQFKKNLIDNDFKLMGENGAVSRAGLTVNGILCVIEFSPCDFSTDSLTSIGDLRFYHYKDTIKLNGKIFTDGVLCLPPSGVDERLFSEFLYTVYTITRCE